MKTLLSSLCLFFALSLHSDASTEQTITLYSYHASPPFIINKEEGKGLNYDVIRELQAKAPEGVTFQYRYIERPALNQRLTDGKPTIVLWANPNWFKPQTDASYLWSLPLFWDKDVIATRKDNKVQYTQAKDLTGLTLGTRTGYVYKGIDDLVNKKQIARSDTTNDFDNLQQLLNKQVDAIIISKSSLLYYVRSLQLINKVVITGKPHSSFKRQLLVTQHYKQHLNMFNNTLFELSKDDDWRFRLSIYGLQDLWLTSSME